MPKDKFGNPYSHKGTGTNTQGNQWDSRDYGSGAPNQNAYHYSNVDKSYYYSNADKSKYYNDGKGNTSYTRPDGSGWTQSKGGSRQPK
ncbi:hypothetical protein DL93DRAFT_2081951 [Clavulina sp. PMI_390]|nr:hypothetical protein DL93DRAFT_2081951 [Clavulina sp. PMI_390]